MHARRTPARLAVLARLRLKSHRLEGPFIVVDKLAVAGLAEVIRYDTARGRWGL